MKKALFGIALLAGVQSAPAWTRAYQLNQSWLGAYTWNSNPKFWVNTSTPENLRPLPAKAMDEWRLSGARVFPYYGGITGRDCGDGDYWWDDDDGYNVVDYWNKCENLPWSTCTGGIQAEAIPIDTYGTTYALAELDIVMCSNVQWSASYEVETNKENYHAVMTHEFGHALGLGHATHAVTPVHSTMHMGGSLNEIQEVSRVALSQDDLNGIETIYFGACKAGDWVLEATSGQNVTRVETPETRCGVNLVAKISTPTSYENWLPEVRVRNSRLGGYLKAGTYLEWEEFDKNHAAIITAYVRGSDNVVRELNYARTAPNHHYRVGWKNPINVNNIPNFNSTFNTWVSCRADILADYNSTYPGVGIKVESVAVQHFINTQWGTANDNGVQVRQIKVVRR